MSKRLRRFTALLTSSLLIFSIISSMIAQASPAGWSATNGSPYLEQTVDGDFCGFRVDSSCTASTDTAHNMLTEAIVIRNFSYAKGYWSFIGLNSKARDGFHFNNAVNGELGFFLESTENGFRLIFNASWTQIAVIEKADIYTFRFVKNTDGIYGLQINGELINHPDIDAYCKSGKTDSYVNLVAQNWMKGEIKVEKLDWMQSSSVVSVPKVKEDITGDTNVDFDGGAIVSTTAKVDWKLQKLELSNIKLSDANDKFCFSLNKNSASKAFQPSRDDGSVISVVFSASGDDKTRIALAGETETELGLTDKTACYTMGIVKSDGKYALSINSSLFFDERIDKFMEDENAGLSYVSLSATDSFSGNLGIHLFEWEHVKGTDVTLKTNIDGSCDFTLENGQIIQSPRRYNFLDSDIVINRLDLSENKELNIYVGKDSSVLPPSALSENGFTLILKKNEEKLELAAIDSDNERIVIGSADISDKYSIALVMQDGKLSFKINDTVFEAGDARFDKLMNELRAFIGESTVYMGYLSVGTSEKITANIGVVMREPEEITKNGFSVITPGGIVPAQGDNENGYSVNYGSAAYAITDTGYDMTQKSLRARVTDVGASWMWFSLSKTSADKDNNPLPDGSADTINRFVFIITPKNNYSLAQISYWNAAGNAGESVITTIDFDWTAEHVYDIRKANDGNWYLAIDEQLQSNISSSVLNEFMEENYGNLRYGIGGFTTFRADKISIIDQQKGSSEVETTGWGYFSSAGGGSFDGNEETGYNKSLASGNLFAFTRESYDITKKSVSLVLDDVGDWLWFGISATGAEDSDPLPNGNGTEVNRAVFIITPKVDRTKAQISYWNANGTGGEHVINLIDFDWSVEHTYDVRKGSDGHWYIAVDSKLISGLTSDVLDSFVASNQNNGLRFAVGGMGKFAAHNIKVIEQKSGDTKINTEGWRYISAIGNGDFEGNDTEGYSVSMLSGDLFAFTKEKYSMTKTGVSFKLSDIRNWLYFSISATDMSDTDVLQVGQADEVNRVSFIITPKIGATRAQFSYWGQNGKSGESVIQEISFGWYDEHTLDVRKDADDGHWYLCIDGMVLSRKYSEVFDKFMEANNPEDLYYGIGGSGCFGATDIKIVDKPPIAAYEDEENGDAGNSGLYVPEDYDFDFSDESNYGDDTYYELDDNFGDDSYIDAVNENINAGKIKVRIKKRKLVEKGHGIIFTPLEKVGMVAGAAAVVAGLAVLVVIVIRKIKRSRKNINPTV